MENIFSSDKCVLIIYPSGASGKFLLNALSLNTAFVYQKIDAVVNNTPYLRYKKIMELIENYRSFIDKTWDDLLMGDIQFYGIPNYGDYEYIDFKEYQNLLCNKKLNFKCLEHFIKHEQYFFRVCHTKEQYIFYRNVWPNSKQILFYNCADWIKIRNLGGSKYKPRESVNKTDMKGKFVDFNCMAFCSKELFLNEYKNLLVNFNQQMENEELVSSLYNSYINLYFNTNDISVLVDPRGFEPRTF